ncbi:UNVERIFIED_CONTAM: hypothetical protein BEN50_14840 [Euhalothece sp. KZN 001]
MQKLSINQKNWILSAHIGFAALWTGTVLSMFLLSLKNMDAMNSDVLHTLNDAITLLDDWVVIPSAIGSVVTATVLCWGTNYGFTKFYWVIAKWGLTIGLIIFGTFWLFPWGHATARISEQEGLKALNNAIYRFDAEGVLLGTAIQVLVLFVIIGISTLKPWGRRSIQNKKQSGSSQKQTK